MRQSPAPPRVDRAPSAASLPRRALALLEASAAARMIELGRASGLLVHLSEAGRTSVDALALAADYPAGLVSAWLGALVVAGAVEHDGVTEEYWLPHDWGRALQPRGDLPVAFAALLGEGPSTLEPLRWADSVVCAAALAGPWGRRVGLASPAALGVVGPESAVVSLRRALPRTRTRSLDALGTRPGALDAIVVVDPLHGLLERPDELAVLRQRLRHRGSLVWVHAWSTRRLADRAAHPLAATRHAVQALYFCAAGGEPIPSLSDLEAGRRILAASGFDDCDEHPVDGYLISFLQVARAV